MPPDAYSNPEEVVTYNLTDREALTAVGALGITLLHLFQRHIPEHKRVARKIRAVEDAVKDLYHGNGEPVDPELADAMFRTWDLAMKIISEEGV